MITPERFQTVDAVTVGTSLTTLIEGVDVSGRAKVNIEVESLVGGQALDAFDVDLKDHETGEYYQYITGTGWDAASTRMLFASADPVGLAAEAKAHLHINVNGATTMRLRAKVASGTASVKVRGCASLG